MSMPLLAISLGNRSPVWNPPHSSCTCYTSFYARLPRRPCGAKVGRSMVIRCGKVVMHSFKKKKGGVWYSAGQGSILGLTHNRRTTWDQHKDGPGLTIILTRSNPKFDPGSTAQGAKGQPYFTTRPAHVQPSFITYSQPRLNSRFNTRSARFHPWV